MAALSPKYTGRGAAALCERRRGHHLSTARAELCEAYSSLKRHAGTSNPPTPRHGSRAHPTPRQRAVERRTELCDPAAVTSRNKSKRKCPKQELKQSKQVFKVKTTVKTSVQGQNNSQNKCSRSKREYGVWRMGGNWGVTHGGRIGQM